MRVLRGAFFLMLPSWWERERGKSQRQREEGAHSFSEKCVGGRGVGVGGEMLGENGLLMEKNLDCQWPPCLS